MADHLDAPGLNSPKPGDARTDITDIYAFQKPGDPSKSILILNVNPLAPTLATAFAHDAVYQLNVDTDGDTAANRIFEITFSTPHEGEQRATVRLLRVGSDQGEDEDDEDDEVLISAPVSFGQRARVARRGSYKLFAGIRSDPFFFDLLGFLSFAGGGQFDFTHGDFFAKKNVFGIALEVPNRALGSNSHVGVWGRTKVRQNGGLVRDDRMGRPAINTVFNHGPDKNTFNQLDPAQDRTATTEGGITFVVSFANTLMALSAGSPNGAYTLDQATGIAKVLLPDILTYDYSSSAGFLNGRKLTDDVINAELGLITNGAPLKDDAGPHPDYLSRFPYLGNPH